MEDESKKSGQKAMRRKSRGEEGLVSCCGDGDVVDVDEGDGGGFGERGKGEKDGVLDANLQMCQKKVLFHACSVQYGSPYRTMETTSHDPVSMSFFSCPDSKINREKLSAARISKRLWKKLRWTPDQLMRALMHDGQRQLPWWVLRWSSIPGR